MSKKLHIILKDSEYRKICRVAEARQVSVAQWVRHTLVNASGQERTTTSMRSKLASIRIAVLHEFPTGYIDSVLAETGAR